MKPIRTNQQPQNDDEHLERLRLQALDQQRRVEALQAERARLHGPVLVAQLEREGRITTDTERASVTKLVAALGLASAQELTAHWPVKTRDGHLERSAAAAMTRLDALTFTRADELAKLFGGTKEQHMPAARIDVLEQHPDLYAQASKRTTYH